MRRLANKISSSTIIEVTCKEILDKGFDKIWDEIREIYTYEEYEIESVKESHDGKIFTIYLRDKKVKYYLD